MLDIFQIKNGKFHKNEKEVNLRDSFLQIEDMFKLATEQKNLFFNLIIDDTVPSVLIIDDQRIKQVLLNLLQNALKFTVKGGITVSVSFDNETYFLQV